ncbi:MAG: hypothetical protein GY895_07855 [Phycisphaera sp.]|nr:hypothetical protein [Phycisphaera sp.]
MVRQHLTLLVVTLLIGLVLGTGLYVVWLRYFPSYSGIATFELIGTLEDATDARTSEDRNEDTVQRLATTEAAKVISEQALVKVIAQPEVRQMGWGKQFINEDGDFNEGEAVVELMDEITAGYRRRTQYFDVRWSSKDPQDVQDLLALVVEQYQKNVRTDQDNDNESALGPFNNSLDDVEDEIATLKNEIQSFINTNGMLSLSLDSSTVQKDLEDSELEKNKVISEIQRTGGLLKQTNEKLSGIVEWTQDDVREAENDPVVVRVLNEVQFLRGQLAEHKQKFGQDHKQFKQSQKALDARIREKDRKVEEVILRNLEGQRKLAADALERMQTVEQTLDQEIELKSAELNDFVEAQATLEQLRADLADRKERRAEIEKQIDQIRSHFARADAVAVQVVGKVMKPREPSSPKWYVVIPGTAVLLLGFVTGGIFLREILDKRVRTTADLTSMPGSRLLGVIPDIKDDPTDASRPESVVRDFPASVLAESHRQFAASFRRVREDSNASSILFVSGMPGAGTSSTVANLAVIAASAGRRVAVIDGNLRRPRIAEIFGMDPTEPGLGDVILGESTLESALNTTQEGIKILTAGTPDNRQFERLDSENLRKVISEFGDSVDVVFVDGPPLVVASEGMGMTDQVDATVLVVRAYSEQRGLVARLMRQLREQPSSFLGLVLNRPRNTAGGYFKRNYEAIAEYSSEPVDG